MDPHARAAREGLLPREPKHFQVFRANLAAMLRYVPTVDDSRVEIVYSQLAARTTNTDTCAGWRRWLPRATYHPVQGDHYSMMQGTNAMQIVDIISRAVERS